MTSIPSTLPETLQSNNYEYNLDKKHISVNKEGYMLLLIERSSEAKFSNNKFVLTN